MRKSAFFACCEKSTAIVVTIKAITMPVPMAMMVEVYRGRIPSSESRRRPT